MGLLTLQTQLKSLKYGNDTVGGGSSNQPYITKPIPDSFSDLGRTGGPDFIIRGGTLAVTKTADDVSRLSKMFADTKSPNGFLFAVKQNALTRLGVKTQAGGQEVYLPTSTLAQAGVSAFGLHFYKQGLNPIPDFNIGGLEIDLPGNIKTYSQVIPVGSTQTTNTATIQNRLYQLYSGKLLEQFNPGQFGFNIFLSNPNNISRDQNILLQYGGGPGSILGIGPTRIKFADQRIVTLNKKLPGVNYNFSLLTFEDVVKLSGDNSARNSPSFTPKILDFRKILRENINGVKIDSSSIISLSPEYSGDEAANIEKRVFLGNPGTVGNIISYTKGKILRGDNRAYALDKINAKQLYSSELVDDDETNDLVKFRIEAIDNDTPGTSVFMHFRAFIDSFSDTYNSTWTPTKYVGRGEEFYTYGGFTRAISINWTVAAQSKDELIPMYQKLNYLASNLTPDYSSNGYMRGPMMRLTVGGYLYSQPGFINNLTYAVDDTSTWEIGINDTNGKSDPTVKELPHLIRVSMNYTPIHEFVPRKQKNNYLGPEAGQNTGKYVQTFGKERYIAIARGKGTDNNNYDINNYIQQ